MEGIAKTIIPSLRIIEMALKEIENHREKKMKANERNKMVVNSLVSISLDAVRTLKIMSDSDKLGRPAIAITHTYSAILNKESTRSDVDTDVARIMVFMVPILLMLPDTEKILCHDTQSRHKFELTLWAVNDTMKDFNNFLPQYYKQRRFTLTLFRSAGLRQRLAIFAETLTQLTADLRFEIDAQGIMSGEGISQSEVLHDITASFHDDQRSDTLCQSSKSSLKIEPTDDFPVPDLTGRVTKKGKYPHQGGGFSEVWQGTWTQDSIQKRVAVKVIRVFETDTPERLSKVQKRLAAEIRLWKGLDHDNVLPLLGTVSDFGPQTSLVSPWLEEGRLTDYLERCERDLDLVRRLQLSCEVAAGLSYLHSNWVTHGDLSGANILITGQGKACICDFGLSKLILDIVGSPFYTSTIGASIRWAAPDLFNLQDDSIQPKISTHSDVYSFGCVMLVIFSGKVPYHDIARDATILGCIMKMNNRAPGEQGDILDDIWAIIKECWRKTPQDRPGMERLEGSLQVLLRSHRIHPSLT